MPNIRRQAAIFFGIDLAGIVPAEILHDCTARQARISLAEPGVSAQSASDSPEAQADADPHSFALTDSEEPHPLSNCPDDIPYDSREVDLSCTFDPRDEEAQDAVH